MTQKWTIWIRNGTAGWKATPKNNGDTWGSLLANHSYRHMYHLVKLGCTVYIPVDSKVTNWCPMHPNAFLMENPNSKHSLFIQSISCDPRLRVPPGNGRPLPAIPAIDCIFQCPCPNIPSFWLLTTQLKNWSAYVSLKLAANHAWMRCDHHVFVIMWQTQ